MRALMQTQMKLAGHPFPQYPNLLVFLTRNLLPVASQGKIRRTLRKYGEAFFIKLSYGGGRFYLFFLVSCFLSAGALFWGIHPTSSSTHIKWTWLQSVQGFVLYHQPLIFDRHVSTSNSFGKLPAYLLVASFLLKASLLLHALEHESLPFAISMHKFVGTSCRWFYENYFSCIFLWFYLLLSSLLPLTFLSVLVPSTTSDAFSIMSQFIRILLENRTLQIFDITVKLFVFVVDFRSYEYTLDGAGFQLLMFHLVHFSFCSGIACIIK